MRTIQRISRALACAWVTAFGIIQSQAAEPPVRILPLGDSLTDGFTGTPVQGGYRNRLYSLLNGAGYQVDFVGTFSDSSNPTLPDANHQGLGGARVDHIQANIGGWLNQVEDPDVILLLIGTNDFYQSYQLAGINTRLTNLIRTSPPSAPSKNHHCQPATTDRQPDLRSPAIRL